MVKNAAFISLVKKPNAWWLGLGLLVLFMAIVFFAQRHQSSDRIAQRLQENVLAEQLRLEMLAQNTKDVLESHSVNNGWPLLERVVKDKAHTYLQVYRNDSLVFWNSNLLSVPLDYAKGPICNIIRDKTGWYLTHHQSFSKYTIYIYRLIKKDYAINNAYLPHYQNDDFSTNTNLEFSLQDAPNAIPILDKDGHFLFGLHIVSEGNLSTANLYLLFFIFLCIYLCLASGINQLYDKFLTQSKLKSFHGLFFVVDLIILRVLDYIFGLPAILKDSFLFEESFSILPLFNSIGDISLNVFLLLVISLRIYKSISKGGRQTRLPSASSLIHVVSLASIWIAALLSLGLVYTLVLQSPFGDMDSFDFSSSTWILFVSSILTLAVSLYIILSVLHTYNRKDLWALILNIIIIIILIAFPAQVWDSARWFRFVVISFVIISTLNAVYISEKQLDNLRRQLVNLVLFSSAFALTINLAIEERQNKLQLETIYNLSHAREAMLEESFDDFVFNLNQDTAISTILSEHNNPTPELDAHLEQHYFKGFWQKFSIQITLCDTSDLIEIQPDGLIVGCQEYFNTLIEKDGKATASKLLFLVDSEPEHIYYIGRIPIYPTGLENTPIILYMDFVSSIIPEGLGYPELLVDQQSALVDLSGYSFANYKNDKLSYKFGNFAYHTDIANLSEFADDQFFNYESYRHIKLLLSENNYLIVSRPRTKLSEHLVVFSVLFILFTILQLLVFLFSLLFQSKRAFNLTLGTRLQTVFMVFISFIIVSMAFLTLFYAEMNNQNRQKEQLNERTYSVFIELQHKLAGKPDHWSEDKEMLQNLLRKFSLVFFSDIHLYDRHGYLVATSRPEVVSNGLISEFVNPMAYEELFVKNKLFYITEESIGSLSYLSSYIPLTLQDDEPVGIINLPYFARQSQEKQAYYRMLFTFINLFVIFGIIGTFVALIFSKYLTKPLRVLEQNIVAIQIDRKNKRMTWNSRDEIGQLIEAYNRMVDKLEQSAELIKHSERESAWREVAKQIAHEIRNPLTPMKLNVQYLEKSYREGDVHFDDKIKRISSSLIQQIDSLDKVAEMFSDFAKMNERKFNKIDLLQLIISSISLFENQDNLDVDLTYDKAHKNWMTLAFEKDLIRVFNNLINNAIQAHEEGKLSTIRIELEAEEAFYTVRISDNGKGIPENAQPKIFQPYFTTKTGGTGLGLAIVKNIINEVGGEIGFESTTGTGTTFILKFKAVG